MSLTVSPSVRLLEPKQVKVTVTTGVAGADGADGLSTITGTSAEALAIGEITSIDTAGKYQLADSSISGGKFRSVAIANQAAGAADVSITLIVSGIAPVKFAAAPAAASNGSPVFLSATGGEGTLTAPTAADNVVLPIGTLQGADGADTTPDCLIDFQRLVRIPA